MSDEFYEDEDDKEEGCVTFTCGCLLVVLPIILGIYIVLVILKGFVSLIS